MRKNLRPKHYRVKILAVDVYQVDSSSGLII